MFLSAHSAHDILIYLKDSYDQTAVLLDVDDTLITPVSRTFQSAPTKHLIDEIKRNKHLFPEYEKIISAWRSQRQVRLTDPDWPLVLKDLQKKGPVFGLTQMNTGSLGSIPSMEKWRYEELTSLGLIFSTHSSPALERPDCKDQPVFYKGIMMTGATSKAETLAAFRPYISATKFVLIDDREIHLKNLADYCQKEGIEFTGILYTGAGKGPLPQDSVIYEMQKKYLLENHSWLEDDEARKLIEN
tara:strand:+ start:6745 stop:7476 length:732 start_codon:yes stop_codon:yes gene_type:complete